MHFNYKDFSNHLILSHKTDLIFWFFNGLTPIKYYINCLCYLFMIDSILFSAVDGSSQQQRKQLSPADLLSFARQTAIGMVSSRNYRHRNILWWLDGKINEVYTPVLISKNLYSHRLHHFVRLLKGLVINWLTDRPTSAHALQCLPF
jgi:hypothetical protein